MCRVTQFLHLVDPHPYGHHLGTDKGNSRADKVMLRDQSNKKNNSQRETDQCGCEKGFLGIERGEEVLKERRYKEWDQSQSKQLHGGKSRKKPFSKGEGQKRARPSPNHSSQRDSDTCEG